MNTKDKIISKLTAMLIALVLAMGVLPTEAWAAEKNLPDWYFLFAIFKNVDADGKDKDGKAGHVTYSMTQDEVDYIKEVAQHFEGFLSGVGVMRAHVNVVEVNETVTELKEKSNGSYVGPEQAASLLKGKVNLDKYDHIACVVSLNDLVTGWVGLTGSTFENGTGHSCINIRNREYALNSLRPEQEGPTRFPSNLYVHEFLHFAERLNRKCGVEFNMHLTGDRYYQDNPDPYACFTDIMLNRVKGDMETGTGVDPRVWQYSPCVIRGLQKTMREVTIPSDISIVGEKTFQFFSNLSKVNFHSGVTKIGVAAFEWCTSLEEVTIPSGVTSIGDWAFQGCSALTKVSIPASVTSIGRVAFYHTGLTDVYYSGTEAQWKAIKIGGSNGSLTNATIHYNSKPKITSAKKAASDIRIENGCAVGSVALNVQNDGDPSELSVYIGCYDTLGRMLGTERLGIAASVGENTLTLQLSGVIKCKNETGLQFRAFLLDNGFSPLCKAIPIK